MENEKISVTARRKKAVSKLIPVLGELGFNKVSYVKDKLVVEKTQGEDLRGEKFLHYRIIFSDKSIDLAYSVPPHLSKRRRLIEVFSVLINVLRLAEGYYDISAASLYSPVGGLLGELDRFVEKDMVDLSAELDELKGKYESLTKRYTDLVRSSEENARILIECEREKDDLFKKLNEASGMSDDSLKELLFNWVRVHGGSIDISEFCKAHGVTAKRAEEGLNVLIQEGYLKKKGAV
ncbi:MAG: hypothetical protein AABW86_03225 [Candidatus Micrarchaeota archaeon]